MADLGELKIPVAMRAAAETIISLTDEVCADLLDQEYASLARTVVAKLARKRPSPIQAGRASTWAGATSPRSAGTVPRSGSSVEAAHERLGRRAPPRRPALDRAGRPGARGVRRARRVSAERTG